MSGWSAVTNAEPASAGLPALGWDADWAAQLAALAPPTLIPARVSRLDRGVCTVMTGVQEQRVAVPHAVEIAVGDWVGLLDDPTARSGTSIGTVLARRGVFRRLSPDPSRQRSQLVAANIDTVLICSALDGPLQPRHLERFLALAWQGGATPILVLTKADAVEQRSVSDARASLGSMSYGVDVHVVSSITRQGMDGLRELLVPGRTFALLGPSGAGKSTLVNELVGADILLVGAVRSDGSGRHTTTHRQLLVLPEGGIVIDTPGVRALSVTGAADGIRHTFPDLQAVAAQCRFHGCSHTGEDGCAFPAALAAGTIDRHRFRRWMRLSAQLAQPEFESERQIVDDRKRQKAAKRTERRTRRSE